MAYPPLNRFVLISGNGRSGSNRLLDILDRSAFTACRNEMNEVPGAQFHGITSELFADGFTAEQKARLDQAVAQARLRRSNQDRPTKVDKDYITSRGLEARWNWALSKDRLRMALAKTPLLESPQEWQIPTVFADHAKLKKALLVLKLNGGPAWTTYLHDASPDAHIIHNIRDPRAYLNSWYNRFAKEMDRTHFQEHFPDLPKIFAYFGKEGAERLNDFSKESLMEIELWRWRYTNEMIHTELGGSDRAITVTYADVDADPGAAAEKIYAFAGLDFNDQVAELVQTMRNTLFAKKHSVKLENETIDRLVDKVLDGSPLRDIPNLF